ncbi:MAG: nitroreductase family protein [Armatimonadota bacterium]
MRLSVDESRCTLCGLCIQTCPADMVRERRGRIKIGRVACIACGHCVAVCPEDAIVVGEMNFEGGFEPVAESQMTPADLASLLKTRRSVRRYRSDEVPRDLLEQMLEASRWAPTGANCQCANFVVLTSREAIADLRERIVEHYRRYADVLNDRESARDKLKAMGLDPEIAMHPHVLFAVPAFIKNIDAGRDRLFFDAPVVIVVHAPRDAVLPAESCAFAAYHVVLMAHALGLGTCITAYASEALRALPDARASLGIRDEHEVHFVLTCGWPDEEFLRVPTREPPKVRWV